MAEVGFGEIRAYVTKRQNTDAQYIATRPIMDLCERSVQRPGYWLSWRWWDKEGMDLEGSKGVAAAESEG